MITLTPLTSRIGCEVSGVAISGDLVPDAVGDIRKALIEHKVLFFRDQHHLTPADHVAFGKLFGELESHPFIGAHPNHPELVVLNRSPEAKTARSRSPYGENFWHSDVSWRAEPSFGSILRAREIPPVGGDTLWADMEAAFNGLSKALQDAVRPLRAVHDFDKPFGPTIAPAQRAAMAEKFPPVEHPVVRTHPDTGASILYVNEPFTSHIVGMDIRESDALLAMLYAQASKPEYQCRLSWRPGTVAFWDNRSTQHYACDDIGQGTRIMERATIAGEPTY
ncbi:TauD/TfdA dioxygenase family protein [Tomitella biformata]|uniref:TauD/TfdA dioxygenase family protein n=1 Tax=Tomitella biformata TaxID=630403 RepID=UPI000465E6BA|nr:TauD/TfdA family dioxygenase [Tomitella biformata]